MAVRTYPAPRMMPADATTEWFRNQRAANPRLFQSPRKYFLTLPAPRRSARTEIREAALRLENQKPRSPAPSVLSAAEVVYWLRRCRLGNRPRIPISQLAAAAGLHRITLFRAMKTGCVSDATCAALTPLLREVGAGTLGSRRRKHQWEAVELRRAPDPRLPPQPRIVQDAEYLPARCRSCGLAAYSAFEGLGGKLYWACDGCVGEPDRMMLGYRR